MRYAVGVLVAAVAVFSAQTTYACKCAQLPQKEAFERAAAVFMGKVITIEKKSDSVHVTFEVLTSYKGVKAKKGVRVVKGKTVVVTTGLNTCGYRFISDEVYVVYCRGTDKKLSTNTCTRTRPASRAKEDLDALGEGPFKEPRPMYSRKRT